ncbi:uncharacterized protein EI97DRAFT_387624, partial [Westerdykella ornata]
DDRWVWKLGRSIQMLTVQTQLLTTEVDSLKQAIRNEKKRRQHGKPLQLVAPTQSEGGAIFWSSNKVQQARDHQAQKEAAAKS